MFWGGPFSQWCPSDFTVDGVDFCCTEQYMMYKKALMFGDFESAAEVMETQSPKKQKEIGRGVKGFVKEQWEAYAKSIVYDANYAKFTQDINLQNDLKNTIGTELVEASPEDKIWGIGLHESDERAYDRSTWLGTNWLGEAITKVREDLLDEGVIVE